MGSQATFMVFLCSFCGRTITWQYPNTADPNRICGPHTDMDGKSFYVHMDRLGVSMPVVLKARKGASR